VVPPLLPPKPVLPSSITRPTVAATVPYTNACEQSARRRGAHDSPPPRRCDAAAFPAWPIPEPVPLLREILARWRAEEARAERGRRAPLGEAEARARLQVVLRLALNSASQARARVRLVREEGRGVSS
jgi:hypothetical protein